MFTECSNKEKRSPWLQAGMSIPTARPMPVAPIGELMSDPDALPVPPNPDMYFLGKPTAAATSNEQLQFETRHPTPQLGTPIAATTSNEQLQFETPIAATTSCRHPTPQLGTPIAATTSNEQLQFETPIAATTSNEQLQFETPIAATTSNTQLQFETPIAATTSCRHPTPQLGTPIAATTSNTQLQFETPIAAAAASNADAQPSLRQLVNDLHVKQDRVIALLEKLVGSAYNDEAELDLGQLSLPISSEDEMEHLKDLLTDKSIRKRLVRGSNSVTAFIRYWLWLILSQCSI